MPAAEAEPDGADEPSPEELAAAALQLKTFVDECHQALENQKLLAAHRKHAPRDNRVRNTDVVRLVAGGLLHDARVKGGLFSIKEAADAGVELLLATATCSTSTHPFSEDDRAHSFAVAQSAIRLHGRDAIILRRSLTIMVRAICTCFTDPGVTSRVNNTNVERFLSFRPHSWRSLRDERTSRAGPHRTFSLRSKITRATERF